jgi:hypothetical protein
VISLRSFAKTSSDLVDERPMLSAAKVSGPKDFDAVLAQVKKAGVTGIIVALDAVTFLHRALLVQQALKHRLPGIYWAPEYVEDGGLMTYSANTNELRRRAATYVDKILKGTKVRSCHQPQDRQGAGPHDPALAAAALGSCHRMTEQPSLLADVREFVELHRPHGELQAKASEPTPNG